MYNTKYYIIYLQLISVFSYSVRCWKFYIIRLSYTSQFIIKVIIFTEYISHG